jgi:aspartokinase
MDVKSLLNSKPLPSVTPSFIGEQKAHRVRKKLGRGGTDRTAKPLTVIQRV